LIKRPLVWILGAYLLGIIIAVLELTVTVILMSALFWLLLLAICHYRLRKIGELTQGISYLVWLLPVLLFLGFLVTKDHLRPSQLYQAFEQEVSCELNGRINMIVPKQQGQALYVSDNLISLTEGDSYSCENVIVYTSEDVIYQVGNRITVQGTLHKFKKATNPGQFNEEQYYKIENIDFKLFAEDIIVTDPSASVYHSFLGRLKDRLIGVYHDTLKDREAGTIIAMLLGEKYLLEDEVRQLYQENGISHILAISGLHVSLIGMSVFWSLRKGKLPIIIVTLITILFIYSYGILTNFSVATNRSVVMMVILLCATLLGKTYDLLSATALSALIILFQNPLQIMSTGFQLSFLAILGIAVLLPILKKLFPWNNVYMDSLLMSFSSVVTTTPIVLYYFFQFPLYSILTNLIILPFITVLTITSFLAGFLGMLSRRLGIFMIGGANYILQLYDLVCVSITCLPFHIINTGRPKLILVLSSYLLILLFVALSRSYQKKALILILFAALLILFPFTSDRNLQITLLDVGQGDAIVVRNGEGTCILIDGGSSSVSRVGAYRIVPFLKSEGIQKLDYAILTHMDQDHINGLTEVIEQELFPVGCLILPKLRNKDEEYQQLEELAFEKNLKVEYISVGDSIREGKLSLLCLSPALEDSPTTSNAGSVVLSLSYGQFDMLLTGDLEGEGEELLLRRLKEKEYQKRWGIDPAVDYDVLKVAHHGSKNSSGRELLTLIQAEYALISCGKSNRYGHPHSEVIERLEELGIAFFITHEIGALKIETDGSNIHLSKYVNQEGEDSMN
jgi:competence protein ComEC